MFRYTYIYMHACTKVGINEGKRDRRGEKKKDDSIEIGADLFNLGTGRPPELFAERSLTLIYTLIHFHDEPFSLHSSFSPTRTRTQSLSLSLCGYNSRLFLSVHPQKYTSSGDTCSTWAWNRAGLLIRVLKDWRRPRPSGTEDTRAWLCENYDSFGRVD